MESRERQHKIDRTDWDPGPWDGESDREEWRYQGLPCLIVRNRMGCWCGYVGISVGHPWYGVGYDKLEGIEVHGGLAYAAKCFCPVCHVPLPGEDDNGVWWIGFDTSHGWDLWPQETAYAKQLKGWPKGLRSYATYKDERYVREEVERLADQVIVAGRRP